MYGPMLLELNICCYKQEMDTLYCTEAVKLADQAKCVGHGSNISWFCFSL